MNSISGPFAVRASTDSGVRSYSSVTGRRQLCLPPLLHPPLLSYLLGLLVPTSLQPIALRSVAEFWLKRNSSH